MSESWTPSENHLCEHSLPLGMGDMFTLVILFSLNIFFQVSAWTEDECECPFQKDKAELSRDSSNSTVAIPNCAFSSRVGLGALSYESSAGPGQRQHSWSSIKWEMNAISLLSLAYVFQTEHKG